MNPDRQFVVDVMNTPSSDYLKAVVLNKLVASMDIDLTRTKLPPGAASDAFAKAKMATPKLSSSIPVIAPVENAPSARISSVPLAMPAAIKFDDKDTAPPPAVETPPPPAAVPDTSITVAPAPDAVPLSEDEQVIDGKIYVTITRAAQLRGGSVGAAYQAASSQVWGKVRSKKLKGVLYLKADVLDRIKDKA